MAKLSDAERARLMRRTIIDIAQRRQRPGTGSKLERLGYPLKTWPDLRDVLTGVPWAVAGAVATRQYAPERGTQDLDIAILEQDADAVAQRFRLAGHEFVGALTIGGSSWRTPDGTPVDVIEVRGSWWARALDEAAMNLDQQGFPTLTLPYLVLMKVIAARGIDSTDVSRMMALASPEQRAEAEGIVRRHAPDLLDDLASLLAMGRLEYDTP